MMRNLHRNAIAKQIIAPQAATATVTPGTGVDRRGFDACLIQFSLGAVSGTTPTCDVKLQESDASGSGFADVTSAVFTQKVAASASKNYVGFVDLKKRKRYLRVIATIAGTTPSFAISVNFWLHQKGRSILDADHDATPEFFV